MRSVSAAMVRDSLDGEVEEGEDLVLSIKEDDSSPLTEVVLMSYVAIAANQPFFGVSCFVL